MCLCLTDRTGIAMTAEDGMKEDQYTVLKLKRTQGALPLELKINWFYSTGHLTTC